MPLSDHLRALPHSVAALLAVARRANPDAWKAGVLVMAVIITAIVLALVWIAWKEKKRTQTLKEIAAGLGFEFFPTGDSIYLAGLTGLELFSRGRQKKSANLMRGASRSFEVGIFDYSYVTGSGKSSRTWKQTILCLQSPALRLPDFMLSPKSFWNMVGAIFGHTEIEIEGHPVFSKMYVVRDSDPEAIRAVFTDDVLSFFEAHLGVTSQGANDRLLLFKASQRAKPEDIAALLEDGLRLLALLQPR